MRRRGNAVVGQQQAPARDARGATDGTRRWEAITYWPLTIVALLFVVAYTFQVIDDLHGTWRVVTLTVIRATWAVVSVDYPVRPALSEPKDRKSQRLNSSH